MKTGASAWLSVAASLDPRVDPMYGVLTRVSSKAWKLAGRWSCTSGGVVTTAPGPVLVVGPVSVIGPVCVKGKVVNGSSWGRWTV